MVAHQNLSCLPSSFFILSPGRLSSMDSESTWKPRNSMVLFSFSDDLGGVDHEP